MQLPIPGLVVPGPAGRDPITIGKPLGGGAFGVVFRASAADGTLLAVKFPQATLFGGQVELNAFLNEVEAAKTIAHEHVLPVVHVSNLGSNLPPYLVMEYADGGTLKSKLDAAKTEGSQLPLDVVLAWSLDLVEGMEAINAKMLHRDLKPDNILFSGDTLKISDFGLSKLIGAATRSMTFKGGQHMLYMAPEGWRGEHNAIQIDMYSLGLVLFELATLSFPYTVPAFSGDVTPLRDMHLFQAPATARSKRRDLPLRFSDMIAKLLEKRAADRYRTWSEVKEALQNLAGSSDSPPRSGAMAAMAQTISERHRAATAQQLQLQAQKKQEEEDRRIDEHQRDQLLARIRVTVEEFNTYNEVHKVTIDVGSGGGLSALIAGSALTISVPYGGKGSVKVFSINPPIDIRSGTARYGALVKDAKGCGFNFLLQRYSANDLYGQWVVCRVSASALSGRKHMNDCRYFGVEPTDMNEVETALRAMHVYVAKISEDVDGAVLEFLQGLVESTIPRQR